EMTRKAGPGEMHLVPGAVPELGPREVFDAPHELGAQDVLAGEQPEQRPCGLRGCARPLPGERGVAVAVAGLAPTAVVVLAGFQPGDGLAHVGLGEILADRPQPG